jgi:hypothetical protein
LEKGKCFPSHGPASGPWPIAPLGQQPVKRPGRDRHDLLAPAEKGEAGQTTSDRGQGWRSGAHQQSVTRRLAGREKGKGTTGGKVGTSKWGAGGRAGGAGADRAPARGGRQLDADGQLQGTVELSGGSLPEKVQVAWPIRCDGRSGLPTDDELRCRSCVVARGGSKQRPSAS